MDRLLNVSEVQEILGIRHKTQVYRLMREEIPTVRIGRMVRVDPSDLQRWMESKKVPPNNCSS